MYEEENCMNRFCFLAIVLFVIIITTLYVMHVGGNFSTSSSDWGSWGAYFGGMMSIVSIGMLYMTLYYQIKEHHSQMFNNVFLAMKDDIVKLKGDFANIEMKYEALRNVLKEENINVYSDIERNEAINILSNAYYEITFTCEYEQLFRLISQTIIYIVDDTYLIDEEKLKYLHWLEFSLDVKVGTLYICYCCRSHKMDTDDNVIDVLRKWQLFTSFDNDIACFKFLLNPITQYRKTKKSVSYPASLTYL